MSNAVVTGVTPVESENNLTDAKQSDSDRQSNQHESEYDTASDSPSDDDEDLQSGEYDDEVHSSEDEEDLHSDLEGEDDGAEGEEEEAGEEGEEKKKVDDDEDRSNPQYIPKKGTFYEHDDRTAENPLGATEEEPPAEAEPGATKESLDNVSSTVSPLPVKPPPKKPGGGDRWSHDRFDMGEQAPKSRSELVSAYGYDIRSEEGPPKVKRSKHYGRGPTKYDRNWEDENAYGKQVVAKRVPRAPPKGEDFPRLNERRPKRSSLSRDDQSVQEGSEDGSVSTRGYSNQRESNREYPRDHRERRQNGGGRMDRGGGGRGGRGGGGEGFNRGNNDKTREFKNRNQSHRGGNDRRDTGDRRDPRDHPRDANRPHHRRGGENSNQGSQNNNNNSNENQSQQPFNGMSFTNSSLAHNKPSNDVRAVQGGAGNGPESDDIPQRMANNSRAVNYGSGRLQRRDDNSKQNVQSQHSMNANQHNSNAAPSGNEMMGSGVAGGLPLHSSTNIPSHHQLQQQQQMQPKRYSEKRQGMRNDQQSQLPMTTTTTTSNNNVLPPGQLMDANNPRQLIQLQQQQPVDMNQQQQHMNSGGGPPPPFLSNRQYVQMDVPVAHQPQQQQMMAPQQPPQPLPQSAPIPAQYANYYAAPDFLPQQSQAPQPNVASANQQQQQAMGNVAAYQQQVQPANNGPPAQMTMNYVPAAQVVAPQQQQNPAQYSQYPAYQSYGAMPIQAAPPSNVAYYAAPPTAAVVPTQQVVPQAQQPPQPRPILPQRRPTNAIPIVSPPDRGGKGRGRLVNDATSGPGTGGGGDADGGAPGKGADDIDHILDNMFVRRPQQTTGQGGMTTSTTSTGSGTGRMKSEEGDGKGGVSGLDEGIREMRLGESAGGGGECVEVPPNETT